MIDWRLVAKATGKPQQNVQLHWPIIAEALEDRLLASDMNLIGAAATIATETPRFAPLSEMGAPSWFLRYEPGTTIGARLGNTQPGDGARYKGRGFIQLTGRANYRAAGNALDLELELKPEQANDPHVAAQVFAWYWDTHHLAHVCESQQWTEVRRLVNGGTNGLTEFLGYVHALGG